MRQTQVGLKRIDDKQGRFSEADAAHIVRCVNNFDALVALLKNGLECGVFDGAPEYQADVQQALAAAEKGS